VAAAKKFDRYKVDLTKYNSAEANEAKKHYRISGVPTIVFLGPDGAEIMPARVEGFLPPELFMERMQVGGTR
jgi:thiol:disulfide interchange protein DsbD